MYNENYLIFIAQVKTFFIVQKLKPVILQMQVFHSYKIFFKKSTGI